MCLQIPTLQILIVPKSAEFWGLLGEVTARKAICDSIQSSCNMQPCRVLHIPKPSAFKLELKQPNPAAKWNLFSTRTSPFRPKKEFSENTVPSKGQVFFYTKVRRWCNAHLFAQAKPRFLKSDQFLRAFDWLCTFSFFCAEESDSMSIRWHKYIENML